MRYHTDPKRRRHARDITRTQRGDATHEISHGRKEETQIMRYHTDPKRRRKS